MRKLPIGLQDFVGLRNDGYIYVDKTDYIYNLIHTGKVYFLSRPRRFGKSLLISTMKAYWQGKRELFKNLKIAKLKENDWFSHPIFHFDFNGANYQKCSSVLEKVLNNLLTDWEAIYGDKFKDRQLGERFKKLLQLSCEQTGQRAVVLVDEYDKPLLEVMEQPELEKHNKAVFKAFFSVLKEADEYLEFVFIIGVTKFEKVSIFSDLNQLRDISLNKDYAEICGITEQEIKDNFTPEIKTLAQEQGLSEEDCFSKLKQTYDGYHFHQNSIGVYNPFSLLNAFADCEFRSYWFETGTPTFLVNKIANSSFDVRKFTNKTLYANERILSNYRADNPDLVPLLYQTGYLTISDYDAVSQEYTLSFPNKEVEYGLLESLIPEYSVNYNSGSGNDIFTLRRYVESGELDGIRDILTALFASIPYTQKLSPFEHYFQSVIYIIFTLLGKYVICEMHTATGRIDCVLQAKNFIYIFEFKRDDSVENALKQIEEHGYALPFIADKRTLFKIGVVFDSENRTLKDWKVVE